MLGRKEKHIRQLQNHIAKLVAALGRDTDAEETAEAVQRLQLLHDLDALGRAFQKVMDDVEGKGPSA